MIKRKDYNALIDRVKEFARQNPAGYKQRVFHLGILGYCYIFLILILLMASISVIAWLIFHNRRGNSALVKLLVVLVILAGLILKSLRVKIEKPTGYLLNKEKVPKLFEVIADICAKQNSFMPDVVLLSNDFNAFISQVPRLGIFGWYKNYLVLGLPYMLASEPNQFKAVLAHEFGHFSGAHGRSSVWTYRIRSCWYNIMANFEQQRAGNFLFGWFFDWYVPYFNAYSSVLAREHEYEADCYANAYAGTKANAEELVNGLIRQVASGPYWESVWNRVKEEPVPPKDVFSNAAEFLKNPVSEEQYIDELQKALKIRTQNTDTHPCLRERLSALGYKIEQDRIVDGQGNLLTCQKYIAVDAARELLDERTISDSLRQFDADWYKDIEGEWKKRFTEVQKMKKELSALIEKSKTTALSEAEFVDRAYLIDQTESRQEALKVIDELLQRYPDNALANYRMGELLIEKGSDKGVEHLKKAMQIDPSLSSASLEKITWYHESKGEYDHVERDLENFDCSAEKDQQDYLERNNIIEKDVFKPHGLAADIVADLCGQLKPFEKRLKEVYLVQKELKTYPQKPMYVLVFSSKVNGIHLSKESFNQKLLNELLQAVQLKVLAGTVFFMVGGQNFIRIAGKVNNSLVLKT